MPLRPLGDMRFTKRSETDEQVCFDIVDCDTSGAHLGCMSGDPHVNSCPNICTNGYIYTDQHGYAYTDQHANPADQHSYIYANQHSHTYTNPIDTYAHASITNTHTSATYAHTDASASNRHADTQARGRGAGRSPERA